MKTFIILLLGVLITGSLHAQEDTFTLEPEPPSFIGRISLVSPKLIAEIAPSEYFTLSIGFWLKTGFWDYEQWAPADHPYVTPSFTLEPRYFINLPDRYDKGKPTRYYSGWYIGLPFNIEFPDLRYALGGTIGFQGIMGRRWYWNISFGPGLTYHDSQLYFSGAGDFALGIILNRM